MVGSDSRYLFCAGLLALACLGGCATASYAPCPIELDGPLADDAFDATKRILAVRYGALAVVDAAAFRLQTDWVAVLDPIGERRATVFRDAGGLAVVVEARSLVEPIAGLPHWGTVRGDAAAERALADLLRQELKQTVPR